MTRPLSLRLAFVGVLALVALISCPALAQESDVEATVSQIFDGQIGDGHANVVLEDETRKLFWAFHVSKFLDVVELRAYRIPYESTDPDAIRALLDAGDDDAAFEQVLANMNLSRGAMYVADVGLNGIVDEEVPVGQGRMRDNFHREQFADHATADASYREWLQRAATLKGRAS